MARILLCCMPFGSHHSPHLALGLLKAVLAQAGISCDVRYFSLDFGRRIGDLCYWHVAKDARSYAVMAGEWVFAPALFGMQGINPAAYLAWAQAREPGFFQACSPQGLLQAQAEAEPFLVHCLQAADWESYDLIGFSSSLQQNNASLALARHLKERWPRLPIIFGGANVEDQPGIELLRSFDWVDYACLGEGEALLPELVRRITAGRPVDGIPGLALRRNGCVHVTPTAVPLADLDSLPYPDYDDFFARWRALFDRGEWHTNLPVETSRGCWWGARRPCTFCGASPPGMPYRRKSHGRALAELEYLDERYAPLILAATDNIVPPGLGPFLSGLQRGRRRLKLYYEMRATVEKDELAQMKRAGMELAQIGVESLSTAVLRLMNKGTTALTAIRALKWCRELGITALWNLLYGMPREDPAEYGRMAELMPALAHLRPPRTVSALTLMRSSPHFYEPSRYGLANVRPADAYRYIYPGVPGAALNNLARHFDFDYADGRDLGYTIPLLRAADVWEAAYPKSILAYVDDGERLRLFDTRPVARRARWLLTGLERALYLACDRQQSLHRLCDRFQEPVETVREILERLADERLMVSEGQAYLSLAVDMGRHLEADARAGLNDGFCLALAQGLFGVHTCSP